ncbi:MAG TPA: GDP-mannose 4,6-dehydratase, partial [Rhabdochlamydiaceae bacterium]|nr:GDP-mannose 4,6-dehydratase [Rhabdochlamydiaceae bacterium]
MFKRLLVTGGAGFMGSAFIRTILTKFSEVEKIVNLDLLTYAGNLKNLSLIDQDPRYHFVRGNILNGLLVEEL